MRINIERLQNNMLQLAQFGKNINDGIDRSIGSIADICARKWLVEKAKEIGLHVEIDGIANLWMKMDGMDNTIPPVTIGSHHDAVANGGMYDGAMGVLLGLEILETIKENHFTPKHPFMVVSFSAEEPNPFQISTMGSRSVTGKLPEETLRLAYNRDNNEQLLDVIGKLGGNLNELKNSQLHPGDMTAFIECHIEQGRNLYENNLSAAVVSKITGIYREIVKVTGEANHAGTTRMEHRHDGFLAAAQAALGFDKIIRSFQRADVTGTVGKIDVFPNSANIIPGEVEFIFDIRIPEESIKQQIIQEFGKLVLQIQMEQGVSFERTVLLDQAPVDMDEDIMTILSKSLIEQQGTFLGQNPLPEYKGAPALVSMAGHDAVHMSKIGKTAMLFVQSIEGKSHCPQEETLISDIEVAGNTLLNALLSIDEEILI